MADWWLTKDGDRTLLALYERHYSAYQYKDGRVRRRTLVAEADDPIEEDMIND